MAQGQTITIATEIRKGDDMARYEFGPRLLDMDDKPTAAYWKTVTATVNGENLSLHTENSYAAYINVHLVGHDTTNLVIVY